MSDRRSNEELLSDARCPTREDVRDVAVRELARRLEVAEAAVKFALTYLEDPRAISAVRAALRTAVREAP